MSKQRVICDTCIWYAIGEGRIDPKEHSHVDLIATGVNLIEFSSTENFKKDYQLVKNAIKAMEVNSILISLSPWSYLLSECVDITYDTSVEEERANSILFQFQRLVDGELDDLFLDSEMIEHLLALIKTWNKPDADLVNEMNVGLISLRKKGIENYGSHGNYKRTLRSSKNSYFEIMQMIRDILATKMNVDPELLNNRIAWGNIELLVHVWDSHIKENVLQKEAKFELNDLNDILNMAYVSATDLYWTEEIKWNKLIQHNPIVKKYLYKGRV